MRIGPALTAAAAWAALPLAVAAAQPLPSGWARHERVLGAGITAVACSADAAYGPSWSGEVSVVEGTEVRGLGAPPTPSAYGREIAVTRDGHVFVPVPDGIALHDASAWSVVPIAWSPGRARLVGELLALDDEHVYFATEGAIGARDGATFGLRSVGTWRSIEGLAGASPTALWATGQGGTVMRWDGARWTRETTSTDAWLRGIAVRASGDAWAWSDERLFRRDGAGWSSTSYGSPVGRIARVALHGADTFVVGERGVARWTGAWTAEVGAVELGSYGSIADACATDHTLEVALSSGDLLTRSL